MKKSLTLLLVLLLAMTVFMPGLAEEEKTVTLITINSPDKLFVEKIAEEFNQENPNIHVEVISTPFDQYDQKIQTMIASGTKLDIAVHNGWTGLGAYATMGYLADLTPYIEKYGYDAEKVGLLEGTLSPWKIDGKVYGLPVHAFPTVMMYNKAMFDEAGLPYPPADYEDPDWTWDKMMEYARALTKNIEDPINCQYGLQWDWCSGGREQDPQYFGLNVFPESTWENRGIPESCNFTDPEVVKVYQTLADLVTVEKVSPPATVSEAVGGNAFFAGMVGMYVCGAWNLAGCNDLGFDIGIAAVPRGGNDEVRSVSWIDAYWVFEASDVKDEAFQFIAYMTQPEVQKRIVEYSGGLAPSNEAALDTYFGIIHSIDKNDMKLAFEGGFKYAFEGMSHLMPDAAALNTILTNEFDPLFKENRPASEVCESVQAQVEEYVASVNEKYGE